MKTDKNTLFRAIGEIDEKYVSEILEEDASSASVIRSFDAAKAATSAKKKASGARIFLTHYLPAVAGILLCAIIVKSFMTSKESTAGNAAATADCAAPAAAPVTEDYETDYAPVAETNSGDGAFESFEAADAECMSELSTVGASEEDDNMSGMPNPFVDCETLEEACEIAGIDLVLADDFESGYTRVYRAMEGKMIEVIFNDGDNEVFRIRKAYTAKLGNDVSGDYNQYSVATNVDSDNYSATLSGSADDEISNAVWNDGTYAYSITFEEPASVSYATDIINMIMAE